ncbi:L-amino-acid oxidase-like protein [Parathielavia appendiculata]|uniref:L-amino-acid oxidase-like protein n=1 Tax=Parathielavia appendiculata TaxID=2587402 RepID=A0AAN6TTL1_9PEZI|nr:L-amino-acid oxidase-like protein [Parathielavia appendiculata]
MTGLTFPLLFLGGAAAASVGLPVQLETRSALNSRLANVHIAVTRSVEGPITVAYGPCTSSSIQDAHHVLGETHGSRSEGTRLVWILAEDTESGGCLSAWTSTGTLAGRSEPQFVQGLQKRRTSNLKRAAGIPMNNSTGIDVLGPWFDGVALLKDKQPGPVDVEAAKAKEIAIVGAGMSGLMTYLVLTQAGMKNVTILEAGQRLGGRVHTEYLSGGPFDYSYQEMGPMRFPYSYQDPATGETLNITDHQLVFQLAAEMNRINGNEKKLSVDFIRWFQTNPNGLVYRNGFKLASGLPPTVAQIQADHSLGGPVKVVNESTKALVTAVEEHMPGPEFYAAAARNMFKAHKDWIENGLKGLGGDTWSEFAFMVNYLGGSLNDTDVNGGSSISFWDEIYEGLYFQATEWRTIDGGLNRLPESFEPLVRKDIYMNRQIERIQFTQQPAGNSATTKVQLHWRDTSNPNRFSSTLRTSTYDYALISAPFPVVRSWRLPPSLPPTITNAINNLAYAQACKVALEYRTRFWEHYENQPITGGCSTTSDIPGIGTICYPSYNINGTGRASILASYSTVDWPNSLTETEHVQMVLDAMTEIHGEETRGLYTGKYNRRCWAHDPLQRGSWASPTIGQHQLYIPEYFKTYDGLIFIGEHTSYTHAWIASALESGIRGSVQLLLELGLVDEAKEVVNKWMARWIDI